MIGFALRTVSARQRSHRINDKILGDKPTATLKIWGYD
jgi:hypothetical protein